MARDNFFTVNELAEYFRLNPKTIYRLAESREIPGQKIDGKLILSKADVLKAMDREPNLQEMQQKKKEVEERSRRTIEKMKLLQVRERFHQSVVRSLKKNIKGCKWEFVVGYDLDTLKERLKRTIPEGYSWQDFVDGNLQLDHIIPGSAFNIDGLNSFDFRRCWELKNPRLLPEQENKKKGAKLLQPFQPTLQLKA